MYYILLYIMYVIYFFINFLSSIIIHMAAMSGFTLKKKPGFREASNCAKAQG